MGCVGKAGIMFFRSFPYGNANEKQNADGTWAFTCQHGNNECIGNMYEACGMEHYGNDTTVGVPTWWKYFYCLENSQNAGVTSVAQNCATGSGLDWNVISTCSGSNPAVGSTSDGNPEMHRIAVATNSLQPPHTFTPWVVLNGKPLTSAQLNLSLNTLVCNAYTGTLPACCSTLANKEYPSVNVTVRG